MIIFLNGPPGSGKDMAAEYLCKRYSFIQKEFKGVLFSKTCEHFNVEEDWFMGGYTREQKDVAEDSLQGHSRRSALIFFAETILKPTYGIDYFGVYLSNVLEADTDYVISDAGFFHEVDPVINKFKTEKLVFVQILRDGCNFSNDSRRYLRSPYMEEHTIHKPTSIDESEVMNDPITQKLDRIHNNGTIEEFFDVLDLIITKARNDHNKQTEDF